MNPFYSRDLIQSLCAFPQAHGTHKAAAHKQRVARPSSVMLGQGLRGNRPRQESKGGRVQGQQQSLSLKGEMRWAVREGVVEVQLVERGVATGEATRIIMAACRPRPRHAGVWRVCFCECVFVLLLMPTL